MARWNPWRALRAREQARLRFATIHPSGGGRVEVRNGQEIVWLDHRLDRAGRNSVLGHEVIHLERGVLPAHAPKMLREKEEACVRRETARRLVPADELLAFAARSEFEPVTATMVAEEFDVTLEVALQAMRLVA